MESRSEKYNYDNEVIGSRTQKNEQLYKNITKTELTDFEVKSNAQVIGDNRSNIDIEKLKSILDTHYQDTPKKRIEVETTQDEKQSPFYETKEYDINVVLNKAKEVKEDDYESDRNKKLRDTQYDILKNLSEEEPMEIDENENHAASKRTSAELEELINTITINEKELDNAKMAVNEDDLFADLKGSDETGVLEPASEDNPDFDLTNSNDEITEIKEKDDEKMNETAFFTKSNAIKEKDYEDFEDLEDDNTSIFVKIIIFVLLILFVAGIFILIKSFI